jgi:hypothetical protein
MDITMPVCLPVGLQEWNDRSPSYATVLSCLRAVGIVIPKAGGGMGRP